MINFEEIKTITSIVIVQRTIQIGQICIIFIDFILIYEILQLVVSPGCREMGKYLCAEWLYINEQIKSFISPIKFYVINRIIRNVLRHHKSKKSKKESTIYKQSLFTRKYCQGLDIRNIIMNYFILILIKRKGKGKEISKIVIKVLQLSMSNYHLAQLRRGHLRKKTKSFYTAVPT